MYLLSAVLLSVGAIAASGCNLYFDDRGDQRLEGPDVRVSDSAVCDGSELHVFGSYEARSAGPYRPGEPWPPPSVQRDSHIRIDRPGRHRIVVSAYEPMRWLITAAPGAEIVKVIAVGYHSQAVELGSGIDAAVEIHSYEQDGTYACGYSWPYNGGGCDTSELLQLAATTAERPVTSFHGCYQVDSWTLNADLSASSTCNSDGGGYQPYELLPPPQDDSCTPGQCGDGVELHVIGTYEPAPQGSGPRVPRDSNVRIDRPGKHRLVLSAYEPVKWRVSAGPGVEITKVIAIGYHTQTVSLAAGVSAAVEVHSYEQDGQSACGYSWPYNGGGCDTRALLAFAGTATNDPLTSFHGCYQGNNWVLNADLSVQSNCSGSPSYALVPPPEQCEPDDDDEVQVVGVYQTRSDHSGGYHPVGTGRVKLDRPGRQTLVLSSYEPTNWKLEIGPGVELQAVYATGYHAQTVELPAGLNVPVTTTSHQTGGDFVSCGFRYPGDTGGCNTPALLAWAARHSGKPVTSFRGCYDGRTWRIGTNLETTADCAGNDLTEARFDRD
jgi:hypothetical protein